jgi:hypothetical protein
MTVWRHCNRGDSVFDAKCVNKFTFQDIPQAHCLVTATRGDIPSISGKVERVNILFMSAKDMLD